jgi:thiaminase/transcriptional activator TenA
MSARGHETLLADVGDAWRAYVEHPFFRAIGDGTVREGQLRFWLLQDIPYLDGYVAARQAIMAGLAADPALAALDARARGAGWADDEGENEEVDFELELCRALGIEDEAERDRFAARPAREGYMNHIARTVAEGPLSAVVVAILPCEWGFHAMGRRLAAAAAPAAPLSERWIAYYASDEQALRTAVSLELTDALWARAGEDERTLMRRTFARSVEHQLAVLDAAWRERDPWPSEDRERALAR